MNDTQKAYIESIKRLNAAAYDALRAARDTTELPMVNRHLLRGVARISDDLVDAGLATAADAREATIVPKDNQP
jgi:hypothetical protein